METVRGVVGTPSPQDMQRCAAGDDGTRQSDLPRATARHRGACARSSWSRGVIDRSWFARIQLRSRPLRSPSKPVRARRPGR